MFQEYLSEKFKTSKNELILGKDSDTQKESLMKLRQDNAGTQALGGSD